MRRLIALALTVAAVPPAAADDPDDDADAAALAAAKKQKKKAKDAAKRKDGDTLEVHGRVFARGAAEKEETALGPGAWTSELTLSSARIGFDYQWREQLRVELSYEAAKSSLRDAYVELDLDHGLRLRAGRMKLPVGAVEQASAWALPTIGRGMVADVVADGLGATGRRSAVELRWKHKGPARPSVTLAVAQGVVTTGGEQPGLVDEGGGLTVAARIAVEPCPTYQLAVVGASRVVNYGSDVARYWNAGLELEVDLAEAGLGLRLWGDAMYGTSHLGAAAVGDADRPFAAAALTAGYRVGGAESGAGYVEPYLGAGWFNPIADRKRDDTAEIVVGVAGGRWKRWRAQAQFAYQNAKALRPAGLLGSDDVNDRQAIAVQLGTAF